MSFPAELTNMVMIEDVQNNAVLVQRRRLSWKGLAFPGGHVEDGESFYESAVREVKEETGLDVRNLTLCGTFHWCHRKTGARFIVMLYKTTDFSGDMLSSTPEGAVFWMKKEDLLASDELCSHFELYLKIFDDDKLNEAFACYDEASEDELRLF